MCALGTLPRSVNSCSSPHVGKQQFLDIGLRAFSAHIWDSTGLGGYPEFTCESTCEKFLIERAGDNMDHYRTVIG